MVLNAGAMVGGYRIEKVIGSGGMGTVYLAANPVLPRSDALKVLSAELSRDQVFRRRFIREADLAASLDHPNIVTVYSRGETGDGQLWIAMQYVDGTDAQHEVDAARMSPGRAGYVVTEVAKALDYAHRRNLVHRDVKPANFLISRDTDERVFLADFGIARALDDADGLTKSGSVLSTIAYGAPETLSEGTVDGRADIYSLGCSLYRMLTGATPFAKAGSIAATAAAHLFQPPPRVTDLVPTLPPGIDVVIAKAMAKDPNQRYQSARELAASASAALRGAPIPASADVTAPTTARPAAPRSSPAPAPGVSMPTPPWQPPAAVPGGQPAYTAAPVPSRSGAPVWRRKWVMALATVVLLAVAVPAGLLVRGDRATTHAYRPQTFDHVHGSTEITTRPRSVAALGPGDADAVLSLGVQPVALVANGTPPGWEKSMITGNPRLMTDIDPVAVAASKPDVIIATGTIDDPTYAKLAEIAPTVTRPQSHPGPGWAWQDRLTWVGRILGRDEQTAHLIGNSRNTQDEVREQHPAFTDRTITVLTFSDTGLEELLSPSAASDYLTGLGFRYSADAARAPNEDTEGRVLGDLTEFFTAPPAAVVVVRTDKDAGSGYNGLPAQFSSYRGGVIIVDTPDVIDALRTGGYAASGYLNSTLVATLARQFH